jgi:hypothetical protein
MIQNHSKRVRQIKYGWGAESFDSVEVLHDDRWVSHRAFYDCNQETIDTYLDDLMGKLSDDKL